jgi:hypothetical protein
MVGHVPVLRYVPVQGSRLEGDELAALKSSESASERRAKKIQETLDLVYRQNAPMTRGMRNTIVGAGGSNRSSRAGSLSSIHDPTAKMTDFERSDFLLERADNMRSRPRKSGKPTGKRQGGPTKREKAKMKREAARKRREERLAQPKLAAQVAENAAEGSMGDGNIPSTGMPKGPGDSVVAGEANPGEVSIQQ